MILSEFKHKLSCINELNQSLKFTLSDGTVLPEHFHVTEVGTKWKHFIDCGGQLRDEKTVSFQMWTADDVKHRLSPERLLSIIDIAEHALGRMEDCEIEVECQTSLLGPTKWPSIGIYGLIFDDGFQLTMKHTDCLAKDKCGITVLDEPTSCCCSPGDC
jgi:hypothetical protein